MKVKIDSAESFTLICENDSDEALLKLWDHQFDKCRMAGSGYYNGHIRNLSLRWFDPFPEAEVVKP